MKRSVQLFIFLNLLFLFISINYQIADYSITLDSFEYKANSSMIYAETDDEVVANVNRPLICGVLFENGTLFDINVTYISDIVIYYNFICDGNSSIDYSLFKSNTITQLSFYLNFIFYLTNDIVNYPSTIDYYDNGLELLLLPFIDPQQETFNDIKEIANVFYSSIRSEYGQENFSISSESIYSEGKNVIFTEYYISYTYNNSNDFDFKVSSSYLLAYSTTTGVLQGSRIQSYLLGKYSNKTVDIRIFQEIEKSDFNLRDFRIGEFTTSKAPFWVVGILSSFISVIVFRKKKKKKREN